MFVWGDNGRVMEDAVTSRDDYPCAKCNYRGRLLLYTEQVQRMAFFVIPLGGWRDFGGVMVCPACADRSFLKKRKFRDVGKIIGGPELMSARHEIGLAIERIRLTPTDPLPSDSAAGDEVTYSLAGSTAADRDRLAGALRNAGIPFRIDDHELIIDRERESAVDELMERLYDSIFLDEQR
jgi:hypothetical protein